MRTQNTQEFPSDLAVTRPTVLSDKVREAMAGDTIKQNNLRCDEIMAQKKRAS